MQFDYHRPKTLPEAWRLQSELPGARYVGGGTDLMVRMRAGGATVPSLISLRNIPELSGIAVAETTTIGALTPVADIAAHPGLQDGFAVLVDAARRLGSVQIRSSATVGGNLCNASPCADTAPPLLVMDARVRLSGPGGQREMPLDDFIVGNGQTALAGSEILAAVLLDPLPDGTRTVFFKKGRVRMDLSLVSLAALVVVGDDVVTHIRLAAGSVAPTPLRLRKVEALLSGQTVTDELISAARKEAEAEVSPITDLRATAEYRRHLIGVYVERALRRLTGGQR